MRSFIMIALCALAFAERGACEDELEQVLHGSFETDSRGEVRLLLHDSPAPIKVSNPGDVPISAIGLPISAKFRRIASSNDGNIEYVGPIPSAYLSSVEIELLKPRFGKLRVDLERASAALRNLAMDAVRSRAERATDYARELHALQTQLGEALATEPRRSVLYHSLARVARQVAADAAYLKARYDKDDNFPPHTYAGMAMRSRAIVGIARADTLKVIGSGVIVGDSSVLSCRHCTYKDPFQTIRFEPAELVVVVGYERGEDGSLREAARLPVTSYLATGHELDYCLLGVSSDRARSVDDWVSVPLSKLEAKLDDALYVVGHPEGGPKLVADNSCVLFPYRVSSDTLALIRARVVAQYFGAEGFENVLSEFEDSYVADGSPDKFVHLHARRRGQPSIGADCDTSAGSSGSPAFLKRSHRLIGLLYAGESDRTAPWTPGWRRHESLVPIRLVVEALEASELDLGALGVRVDPP